MLHKLVAKAEEYQAELVHQVGEEGFSEEHLVEGEEAALAEGEVQLVGEGEDAVEGVVDVAGEEEGAVEVAEGH